MNRNVLAVFTSTVLLSACLPGIDDTETGVLLEDLKGTWSGAIIDSSGTISTVAVTVSSGGDITSIVQGGTSTGLTGSLKKKDDNNFSFTLSDDTDGGFLVDDAAKHLAFIDDGYGYGVLQKNADTLPGYSTLDLNGFWSGFSVQVDYYLSITDSYHSSATVETTGSYPYITGSDKYGSFSAQTSTSNSTWGYWTGTWSNDSGESGNMLAMLSADKMFAGSWACASGFSSGIRIYDASYCTFAMWNKK